MNSEYYEVGSCKPIQGGVVYYPEQTDNGLAYKSEKAIKEREGICYICEGAFSTDMGDFNGVIKLDEDGGLIVSTKNLDKLIDYGFIETWHSAREQVKDNVELYHFAVFSDQQLVDNKEAFEWYNEFIDHITECALDIIDWQGLDTYLQEMDIAEDLDYFLQEKFTEFAKERLKNDGDETEYEDNEDLFNKLSKYLGCYCYRDDDFSITSWDDLIDKWEDDPNY